MLPPLRRRIEHEAGLARVRRQVAAHRPRRRPDLDTPPRRPPAASSSTRARCATPARACWSTRRSRTSSSRRSWRGQKLQPGDPLDPKTQMGAMVDESSSSACSATSRPARRRAPTLAMGGKRAHVDDGGYYIEPTMFDGVDNEMTIAQEEIFGPVLATIPFRTSTRRVRSRTTRSTASPRRCGRATSARRTRSPRPARRHRLGQLLRPRRQHDAVRRLQAVGHRARQVAARAREVHAAQDHLDPSRLSKFLGTTHNLTLRNVA